MVFAHKKHADDYGVPCEECHHESDQVSMHPLACTTCHPAEYDQQFIEGHKTSIDQQYCSRCHHAEMDKLIFDHKEHEDSYSSGCTDCHHDTDIEPEPQACGNCHMDEGDETIPSLRDAAHTRCETCHVDFYEEKLEGCTHCHGFIEPKGAETFSRCASCHYGTKDVLLPPRMKAYHDSCMNCHENAGGGPFGPDSCKQCHTR